MSSPLQHLRERLGPRGLRVASALIIVLGVWVASRQLKGAATREVELRLSLVGRSGDAPVRAVTVQFYRENEEIRSITQRWTQAPPELVARVSLPEGRCEARVSVERGGRLLERSAVVEVRPDEVLRLRAPESL